MHFSRRTMRNGQGDQTLAATSHFDERTIAMSKSNSIAGLTSWRTKPQRNNKSGFLGVTWSKTSRKWVAQMTVGSKSVYIGSFDNPKEAHEAYLSAKRKIYPGFLG